MEDFFDSILFSSFHFGTMYEQIFYVIKIFFRKTTSKNQTQNVEN